MVRLLNDEPWLDLPLLILNLVNLKHYPFMINLNKCSGSCNLLFPKIYVPTEKKKKKKT